MRSNSPLSLYLSRFFSFFTMDTSNPPEAEPKTGDTSASLEPSGPGGESAQWRHLTGAPAIGFHPAGSVRSAGFCARSSASQHPISLVRFLSLLFFFYLFYFFFRLFISWSLFVQPSSPCSFYNSRDPASNSQRHWPDPLGLSIRISTSAINFNCNREPFNQTLGVNSVNRSKFNR